jgi:hypothetical protein
MAHIRASGKLELEHIALAPLRWEALDVSVDDVDDVQEIEPRIVRAVGDLHARLESERSDADVVGCRVKLVGRTRLGAALHRYVAALEVSEFYRDLADTLYFVDRVTDAVQPAIDLAVLARQADPPGLLARRLLALSGSAPDAATDPFLRAARKPLQIVTGQSAWRDLPEAELGDANVRARLLRVGTRALESLLAQRESSA